MTSIPASRSARAITFAPRSCPSSPAFATITRSGRAGALVAVMLELGRLRVAAVHAHHRVDDLAFGGDRLDAIDQVRHDVGFAGARALERGKRRFYRGGVAALAHALHRARLAALDLHADLQQVGRLDFVRPLERVDADDHALARLDRALVAVRRVGDLALRVAGLDRLDHPAELRDVREVLLDLALHLVGERLDKVRAAERVDHV